MKQIRLKNSIRKIESCQECPFADDEYLVCNLSNRIIEIPDVGIHEDCLLEDAE